MSHCVLHRGELFLQLSLRRFLEICINEKAGGRVGRPRTGARVTGQREEREQHPCQSQNVYLAHAEQ